MSGILRWQPAACLRVTGSDAANFLQGQFTNDLARGTPSYGLWLNVKGKVLADSFVVRRDDAFWIVSYQSSAAVIRERLESFIIADDVVIEDLTADWLGVALVGDAAQAVETPPTAGFVFPGRRGFPGSLEWVHPRSAFAELDARLREWPELNAIDVERQRIRVVVPAVPRDVGPGDLPNEAGLEVDAISYTKGCYLGQEVMARLKSMGQVRRRLRHVRGVAAPLPALPAPLFIGPRQVGELRSAVALEGGELAGLAMVSLLQLAPGASLALAANGPAAWRLDDAT